MSNFSRRVGHLEVQRAAVRTPGVFDEAALMARLDALDAKRQAYAAMSVAEKIASKTRELQELGEWAVPTGFCVNTAHWHGLSRRMLELDIMSLEGTAADVIEIERLRANAALRYSGNAEKVDAEVSSYRGLHRPRSTEQILERLDDIAGQINAGDTPAWILDDLEAEQRKLLAELRGK